LNHNRNKNISCYDQFRAYILYSSRYLIPYIQSALIYRRIYRNYSSVIFRILRNRYPIEAIYRKDNSVLLNNRLEAGIITQLADFGCKECEIVDNKVTIYLSLEKDKQIKVELYDAISNGELIDIFFRKIYDFLPVKGKTVIDIGANIGDSCIYFALRGSSKIIAVEPFPRNFEYAKKNIDVNGFTDKIKLHLAGCAANAGHITIDPLYKSNDCSTLIEFNQGITIPLVTLQDILIANNVYKGETVLKMDCEGCEYDTILTSTADTLKSFSYIQLEYHQGYKNLKEKLEKSGFKVSVTRPMLMHLNLDRGKTTVYTGFLYATNNKNKEMS
jgi:FkbM family methyltransferase